MEFTSPSLSLDLPPPTLISNFSFPDLQEAANFYARAVGVGEGHGCEVYSSDRKINNISLVSFSSSDDTTEECFDVAFHLLDDCTNVPAALTQLSCPLMSSSGLKRQADDICVQDYIKKKRKVTTFGDENNMNQDSSGKHAATTDPMVQRLFNASNKQATGGAQPIGSFSDMMHGQQVPSTPALAHSEVVSGAQPQWHQDSVFQDSQETQDVHGAAAAIGCALRVAETNLDSVSQKVVELIHAEGLSLDPSAVDVIMAALNPCLVQKSGAERAGKGGGEQDKAGAVRLGDTPGRWPSKKNKSVTWGEDGELWLMRQLCEWGSNTCDNQREKAQMNKDLVSAMQREFGLSVDGNCVKNKQRDLEDTFQTYEKVRKNLSGLGWQDSQVAWDPEVWEEFKRHHPDKAADLEGHKRLFTSEKYKLMSTLWGGKSRANGELCRRAQCLV